MPSFWAVSSSISSLVFMVVCLGAGDATCWVDAVEFSCARAALLNSFDALLNSPLACPNARANCGIFAGPHMMMTIATTPMMIHSHPSSIYEILLDSSLDYL